MEQRLRHAISVLENSDRVFISRVSLMELFVMQEIYRNFFWKEEIIDMVFIYWGKTYVLRKSVW